MNANNNQEIITLGDFTRVVKWYEYRDNLKKLLKVNIKNSIQKEYFFISSQLINDFKNTFHYEQLKHNIKDFKNNVNQLNSTEIENLYLQFKNKYLISLEQKKKLKMIPNNNILHKELYIKDNCIIRNYYDNFTLIDKQTFEEFKKEYRALDPIKFDILLGSGIFIIEICGNILEVGIFSDDCYSYKLYFFIYPEANECTVEKEKIIKEGIDNYFIYYNINKDEIMVKNLRKYNGKEIIVVNLYNYINYYQANKKVPMEIENNIMEKNVLNELDISKKRGLINIGNKTSRLNSIIQLLTSIKEIRDFLFDENNKQDIVKYDHIYILSSTLIKIFDQLYTGKAKDNNVESLNIILNFINPGKSNIHMDQYLLFILDTLHDELNKSQMKKSTQINLISFESPPNTEEQSIQVFQKYYNEYYQSIIADTFNWIRKRNYMCKKCNSSFYSLQAFPYIEFDLDEIHKYTIQQNTEYKKISNDYNGNKELLEQKRNEYMAKKLKVPIHITDCFKYYLANIETTNMACSTSQQLERYNCRNLIHKTPKYFCMILNRRANTDGINITLSDELNLENYIELNNEYKRYKLFGLLVNTQSNSIEKHYIAIIRNYDQSWFIFDDEKISKVKDEKMIYNSFTNKTRLVIYKAVKY